MNIKMCAVAGEYEDRDRDKSQDSKESEREMRVLWTDVESGVWREQRECVRAPAVLHRQSEMK